MFDTDPRTFGIAIPERQKPRRGGRAKCKKRYEIRWLPDLGSNGVTELVPVIVRSGSEPDSHSQLQADIRYSRLIYFGLVCLSEDRSFHLNGHRMGGSVAGQPAIQHQRLPGHELGFRAGEVNRGGSDFIHGAEAAQRHAAQHHFAELRIFQRQRA